MLSIISEIGHYVVSWVFGIGGVAMALAIIAWLLWFFTPAMLVTYKSQLLHIAIILSVFTATGMYYSTSFYEKGLAVCHAEWDAANKQADADKKALEKKAADLADQIEKAASDAEDLKNKQAATEEQLYAEKLKTRVGGDCPLTDDDLNELRRK